MKLDWNTSELWLNTKELRKATPVHETHIEQMDFLARGFVGEVSSLLLPEHTKPETHISFSTLAISEGSRKFDWNVCKVYDEVI